MKEELIDYTRWAENVHRTTGLSAGQARTYEGWACMLNLPLNASHSAISSKIQAVSQGLLYLR